MSVHGRTVPLVVRRRFWRLIRDGHSTQRAAAGVGVSCGIAQRWFRHGGGMPPITLMEPTGRFLSAAEREQIGLARAAGAGVRAIARQLGRDPATVSRELRRNASTHHPGRYSPRLAQAKAERRARRPKPSKLATNRR